ncbi:hypothetical protein [Rhodospirillaceae bacterium SYSU D60014]|uniref:amino acid kinase family protein n=1 Tax=Virgifigura deserti TaxID=2268457 RepID=UPI0013C443EB
MTTADPTRLSEAWVVKLGGSLAESADLRTWLDILAGGAGGVVLVPGGGPFADQVRKTQQHWAFDDGTAHRLALLAMEQYGLMLAALHPALRPAGSRMEIARIRRASRIPVWMPTRMALGRPEIPESWNVTSDSLAAWLAGRLRARRVVLIKSVEPPQSATAADLARRGIVDPLLPDFLARSGADLWCIGPAGKRRLHDALRGMSARTPECTAGTD